MGSDSDQTEKRRGAEIAGASDTLAPPAAADMPDVLATPAVSDMPDVSALPEDRTAPNASGRWGREITPLRKPEWLKITLPTAGSYAATTRQLRAGQVHTVCEAALCPNRAECFSRSSASFLILGTQCTRNCAFCNVASGRPEPPDATEPERLAETIRAMDLRYVVLTSVTRDDLDDGGAGHFARCVEAIKTIDATINVEILTPDFRFCQEVALEILQTLPISVFNHNIETVPALYPAVRIGADYALSLRLLKGFSQRRPQCPVKSGLMLGLGERNVEVRRVLDDLMEHGCRILTLGQYLQPSRHHWPVQRYIAPEEFDYWRNYALGLGFESVASGPKVRSSYRADELNRERLESFAGLISDR